MTDVQVKKTKVVLIEDSRELAGALSGVLGLKGIDVVVARDGVTGIETAKREKPDLILLDLMLPKVSGYDVCKTLKTNTITWKIPIVIMSTLTKPDQIDRAKDVGADHFIAKPYDLNRTVEEILKFLPKK